jgi:hypothetical protein
MSKQSNKPFRQEKAQTFVEFALVFPLLLIIVYGLIEFGRMMFIYTAVTSSSREGARYGSAAGDVGGYLPHYAHCEGIITAAERVGILAGALTIDITYDQGPGTADYSFDCWGMGDPNNITLAIRSRYLRSPNTIPSFPS